jgi:predicted ribosomally synthesized peptide with nif11-like leader
MSEEQLPAFLKMVKTDAALQKKLIAATDAVAVVAIAKDAGFSIAAQDLESGGFSCLEISDIELEGVAGGDSMYCPTADRVVANSCAFCTGGPDC